jgi:hypothetical protein
MTRTIVMVFVALSLAFELVTAVIGHYTNNDKLMTTGEVLGGIGLIVLVLYLMTSA